MSCIQYNKFIALGLLTGMFLAGCASTPTTLADATEQTDKSCLEESRNATSLDYMLCRERHRLLQVINQKNDEKWDEWLTLRARYSSLVGPGHFVSGCGGLSSLSLGGFASGGGLASFDSWSPTQGLVC